MPKSNVRTMETVKRTAVVHYRSDTLNEEARTIDFTLATDAPADFGGYFEILGMEDGEIRTKRLDAGIVPVLDSHPQKQWKVQTIDDQFGIVTKWSKEDGVMVGTLKFAKDERSERAFQKLKDGVLRTGSIGYYVYAVRDVTPTEAKKKTYRAIDWELIEFSLVSIPADPDAQSRNESVEKIQTIILDENQNLTERNSTMPGTNPEPQETKLTAEQLQAARQQAAKETQERILDIQSAVRSAGLEPEYADELIKRDLSMAEASKEIFAKMAAKNKQTETVTPQIDVNHQAEDKKREERISSLALAIEHRNDSTVKVDGLSRQFAGMRMLEMARETLRLNGKDVRFMDDDSVIRQAFQGTSDFPIAAGSAIEKKVKKGYDVIVENFKPLITETSRSDFKTSASVSLSDAPALSEIKENGEFETGTFSESAEQYKIATYGKRVALTREAIINDDLSLFDKIPTSLGAAGGRKLHKIVWDIILSNGKMSDNKTLFHADHKNLAASAATLEAAVEALLLLVRKQVSPKGEIMNYNPGWLIVGADQEIAAKKLITSIVADSAANVNVLANTLQGVIVEATVAAKDCYLTGRKEEVDMIEVAWLKGKRGVNIRQRENSNILGMEWDVFMDVGAKALDHRGLYKGAKT